MGSSSRDEEEGGSREHSKEETYWKRVFNQNRRRFPEVVKRRVKIFMVLLIIQVSLLDPLFFYIPVIDGRQKCVRLDEKLGTALMVFRSLIDSFYVIYIIVELRKYQYTRLGEFFLIDFLAALPLPQVVILIFIPAMRGSRFLNAMYLLRSVVLCQFVPRSFRAYLFITSGTFGAPAKARFKFSPLMFLLGIDVIGAFWYFLSVERLVQCWTKACKTRVGCVNSYYCKDNIGDHTSLKHFCPIDGRKTDFFDFGIFSDAIKDRVLEMTYFPKKLLYCFQWSLQNLSGFGQNLKTSTYIGEKLFAISMSILGLILFFLLLGNLQTYMESQRMESQRKEEREEKKLRAMESIENWPPLEKLSLNLGRDIKKELKYNWEKYTTEEGISLYALPPDLKRRIECEHGSELLEKVKAFKYIDKKLLDDLSKSIELRLLDESECIVEEGKAINDMFFILHGELEADSSLGYIIRMNIIHHVSGEEVAWDIVFNDLSPSFELQRSTMTIKALTRVHALALPVNKARDFFHHLPNDLRMSIWREPNFVFLKKVKAFEYIDQNVLNDLSASIQPKLFDKGECIVEEGKTINEVVFILHGKLEARSSPNVIIQRNILTDGEICGEEVIHDIVFDGRWSSFELCGSTITVKVLARAHALVLPVNKVRDFFHSLPDDLKMNLWRELNFVFLKKVKAFKYIDQNVLDYLTGSIQPRIFQGGEYIAKAGEIMNDVVFILHGMVEASGFQKFNVLKGGDICGEELIWETIFYDRWPSSTSFGSIVTLKALTRVHALVLPVHKVRDFFHQLPDDLKRSIISKRMLKLTSQKNLLQTEKEARLALTYI